MKPAFGFTENDFSYGVLAKGCSNRRSAQLIHQVRRWHAVRYDKFVGCVPTPDGFAKPLHTVSIHGSTVKLLVDGSNKQVSCAA